jgi:protein-S-isoprenylcysteine O-methyltransferase Ste14
VRLDEATTVMTMRGNSDPPKGTQAVAQLGVFRPPLVYLASIVVGLALHWAWPLRLPPGVPAVSLGIVLIATSVLLFGYSVKLFRAADTPVPAWKPTTAIVRTGPYRVSRNPIYLAFSLFQLGVAIWIGSWWLIGTLVLAVAIMNWIVVPREERYLESRFGAEYRDYKDSVRRWF